jgi:hypothetical protein
MAGYRHDGITGQYLTAGQEQAQTETVQRSP